MVTGTQGPSALLLSHPWGIVFAQEVSPPHSLHFSQQEGRTKGQLEDAHIESGT